MINLSEFDYESKLNNIYTPKITKNKGKVYYFVVSDNTAANQNEVLMESENKADEIKETSTVVTVKDITPKKSIFNWR